MTQRPGARQGKTYHHNYKDRSRLTGRYSELDIIMLELLNSARVHHID
jgi:hypothetical protein